MMIVAVLSLLVAGWSLRVALSAKAESARSADAAEKSAGAAVISAAEQVRARADAISPRLDASEPEIVSGPFSYTAWGNPQQSPVTDLHRLTELTDETFFRPESDALQIGYIVRLRLKNTGTSVANVKFGNTARYRTDDGSIDELDGDYELAKTWRLQPGEERWLQCGLHKRLADWIDAPREEPAFMQITGDDGRVDGVSDVLYAARPLSLDPPIR